MNPEEINQVAAEILRNAGFDADSRTRGALGLRDKLLTATALDQLPDPEWLIDKYIPRGALAVLYGKPGSCKSFVALDWALSVATGRRWGGWDVHSGGTLYVAAEGIAGMSKRKRAWEEHRQVQVGDSAKFLPVAVNLLDGMQAGELVALVDDLKPALVVIDTMARCLIGGDENSAKDVGLAVSVAGELIRRTGCTVLIVHHTSKNGDSYRGSSALEGAADTIIRTEESEGTVTLSMEKQKDAAKVDQLRLSMVGMGDSVAITTLEWTSSLRSAEEKLHSTLAECFWSAEASTSQLQEASGIVGGTYFRAISALVKRGFVENRGTKSRARYALTAEGSLHHSRSLQSDME